MLVKASTGENSHMLQSCAVQYRSDVTRERIKIAGVQPDGGNLQLHLSGLRHVSDKPRRLHCIASVDQ